jgi:hypothetical protein
MNKSKRPPGYPAHAGMRQLGATLFGGLNGHYRALRKRLSDMLGRGDRDYATLSALSQEIGRMRQKIRADLEQRRAERKRRKAAKSHTVRRDAGFMKGRPHAV